MNRFTADSRRGFTTIELIIAAAMVAIILTMAVPAFSNGLIKRIIGDSLSIASSAKTSIIYACQKDPRLSGISNQAIGFDFRPTAFISAIELGGDCYAPTITMTIQAIDEQLDLQLTIIGEFAGLNRRMTWACASDDLEEYLPESC